MRAGDIVDWLSRVDLNSQGLPEVVWGSLELPVERLVIAWSADVATLAAAARLPGASLVLTRAHPFYAPPVGFDPAIVPSRDGWAGLIGDDIVAAAKREFLGRHELVLVTAPWLWDLGGADKRSLAFAQRLALGDPVGTAGAAVIVDLETASTVFELVELVTEILDIGHTLVVGNVEDTVRRAVIAAGVVTPSDLALALRDPLVDVVIAGEVVEWEGGPYIQDANTVGRELSLIAVGNAVSEGAVSEALGGALERAGIPVPVVFFPTSQAPWAVRKVVTE